MISEVKDILKLEWGPEIMDWSNKKLCERFATFDHWKELGAFKVDKLIDLGRLDITMFSDNDKNEYGDYFMDIKFNTDY